MGLCSGRNLKVRLVPQVMERSGEIIFLPAPGLQSPADAQQPQNPPAQVLTSQDGRCSRSWILVPGIQNNSVNPSAKMVMKACSEHSTVCAFYALLSLRLFLGNKQFSPLPLQQLVSPLLPGQHDALPDKTCIHHRAGESGGKNQSWQHCAR